MQKLRCTPCFLPARALAVPRVRPVAPRCASACAANGGSARPSKQQQHRLQPEHELSHQQLGEGHGTQEVAVSRRKFLVAAVAGAAAAAAAAAVDAVRPPDAAAISGLQEFPLHTPLTNNYWFLRAGESISTARDEVRTNPVEKTSVQLHGLTRRGIDQALVAADKLRQQGVGPVTWLWSSQQQSCQETAELVAYELGIRREQMVPEFAYLDARGVGAMEGKDVRSVSTLLSEIDSRNPDLRMEGGIDGTPNESVSDVFVRVRQLMSKLETQYFGDDIVIIAPDSDLLSVLECALVNEPLTNHRKFSYSPGEIRKISPVVVPRDSAPRLPLFSL